MLHAGEKPHKCELCDFTCRDVSYLSKHMLTHSNDKNFMCTECGYITKWKHYLNVHMRKHTGDLRYDSWLHWPGSVVRASHILLQGLVASGCLVCKTLPPVGWMATAYSVLHLRNAVFEFAGCG